MTTTIKNNAITVAELVEMPLGLRTHLAGKVVEAGAQCTKAIKAFNQFSNPLAKLGEKSQLETCSTVELYALLAWSQELRLSAEQNDKLEEIEFSGFDFFVINIESLIAFRRQG